MSFVCAKEGRRCVCSNVERGCDADSCIKKRLTNADRIKADDKALAEKLTDCTYRKDHELTRPSWADPYGNSYLTKQDAVDEWLDWLQQPAEGTM